MAELDQIRNRIFSFGVLCKGKETRYTFSYVSRQFNHFLLLKQKLEHPFYSLAHYTFLYMKKHRRTYILTSLPFTIVCRSSAFWRLASPPLFLIILFTCTKNFINFEHPNFEIYTHLKYFYPESWTKLGGQKNET